MRSGYTEQQDAAEYLATGYESDNSSTAEISLHPRRKRSSPDSLELPPSKRTALSHITSHSNPHHGRPMNDLELYIAFRAIKTILESYEVNSAGNPQLRINTINAFRNYTTNLETAKIHIRTTDLIRLADYLLTTNISDRSTAETLTAIEKIRNLASAEIETMPWSRELYIREYAQIIHEGLTEAREQGDYRLSQEINAKLASCSQNYGKAFSCLSERLFQSLQSIRSITQSRGSITEHDAQALKTCFTAHVNSISEKANTLPPNILYNFLNHTIPSLSIAPNTRSILRVLQESNNRTSTDSSRGI